MTAATVSTVRAALLRGPLALVASGLLASVLALLGGASLTAAGLVVAVTTAAATTITAVDPVLVGWVRARLGWYAPRHATRGRYTPRHLAAAGGGRP